MVKIEIISLIAIYYYICVTKQQASGDRAFKIEIHGEFKEVLLSARVVMGLVTLNGKKRNDMKTDKVFLKALVIGVCTLKRVKESPSPFDEGIVQFVKGNILNLSN